MANYDIGSLTPGRIDIGGKAVDEVLLNIQAGLDAVNYKSDTFAYKNQDLALLAPHVLTVEGKNNTVLAYEDFKVFFQDSGLALDPEEYSELNKQWVLKSRAFEAKSGSFTPDWFRKVMKAGGDPRKKINERTVGVLKTYNNIFKPNYLWEAFMTVAPSGGTYYDNFGALRDVVVDKSLIENPIVGATAGQKGSLQRLHYRAIAANTGVSFADLQFVKEYMNEYVDLDINNLVGMGTLAGVSSLASVFEDTLTRDSIKINGIPATPINGIPFITTKMLPDNIIAFAVLSPGENIIATLVNDVAEFQGMTLVPEKSFQKFETLGDLEGSKFVIEDIGHHVIGRHKILFLDIATANYNSNREMQAAGYTSLTNRRKTLAAQWRKSNITPLG